MNILKPFLVIASKITIFLGKIFIRVMYNPKIVCVDKKIQTNKFKNPSIIIANHTSVLDPILLLALVKGKRNIVVAKDWFEMKKFHWILSTEKCIPCDRFNLDTEWIQYAKKDLSDGKSVIIFPEGKTRQDGELNEFKSGFAFLARYTGNPVVSIGIDGIYKFGHRTKVVIDVPEVVTRTKGVPSSVDLSQKSEYFREKVKILKKMALER